MSKQSGKKRQACETSGVSDSKRKKTKTESECVSYRHTNLDSDNATACDFLSSIHVLILQAGIEKMRMNIFKNNVEKFGGTVTDAFSDCKSITHIIVDDKMTAERMCKILKIDKPPDNIPVIKSTWLSTCFREKKLVDSHDLLLDLSVYDKISKDSITDTSTCTKHSSAEQIPTTSTAIGACDLPIVGTMFGHSKKKIAVSDDDDDDSDYEASDGEETSSRTDVGISNISTSVSHSGQRMLPKGNWVCAQSSKNKVENCNKHITDKLQEMVRTYESTNDTWRAFGYQKAIQALKRQSKQITTFEEAKELPGVGKRLAEKIWEIAESGELRKLNEFKSSEVIRVIELFKDVWGAGATTARAWYQQGLRTLDDLKTKANLTTQQKIGLQHYHDFLNRMPRAEAGEIEQVVKTAAEGLQDGVVAQACGSYRRGKATCGDVDVLVTHPDGKSHKGLFAKLLAKLKEQGFLTDDLVTAEENGSQKKYLGVCKLPGGDRKYRRIDIIVVPYDEYACAVVYFTGSAHFNRSLRHLAKKMGMSLSEHALKTGVVRHGAEKVYEGTPLPTPTEEAVFIQMGIPYRPPEERDH